ncbi:MAG: AraC family transcriptional regulator [Paenibacillaceae bacterium]|nr:AraC family transcriptional regulator [Paenibacillaceae bacterium]
MGMRKRSKVFWRYFASYFGIIIIPALAASMLAYIYFVQMIEQEVERANRLVIENFAKTTDSTFSNMQAQMIHFFSSAAVDRYVSMSTSNDGAATVEQFETLYGISRYMKTLQDVQDIIETSYLYFPKQGIVVSEEGYFDSELFFEYYNRLEQSDGAEQLFSGRRMFYFSQPMKISSYELLSRTPKTSETCISVLVSFPFHAKEPDAYLVANMKESKLRQQILLKESDHREMAIIDAAGHFVSYTGEADPEAANVMIRSFDGRKEGSGILQFAEMKYHMSFTSSGTNNWKYVVLNEWDEMRRQAKLVQISAIVFLLFFIGVGLVASLALSEKMYHPIRLIRQRLEKSQRVEPTMKESGNELDLIHKWSDALIVENNKMNGRMNEVKAIIHEHFLNKLLSGDFRDKLSIQYYSEEIDLDLPQDSRMAVLCIDIQYFYPVWKQLSGLDQSFTLIEMKHKIQKRLSQKLWFTQMEANLLVCIVEVYGDGELKPEASLIQAISNILQSYNKQFKATLSIGPVVLQADQLRSSYLKAQKKLVYRTFNPEFEVISGWMAEQELDEKNEFEGFLSQAEVNRLSNLIQLGDADSTLDYMEQLLTEMMDKHGTYTNMIRLSQDILNTLVRITSAEKKRDVSLEKYSDLLLRLRTCAGMENVLTFFRDTLNSFFAPNREESGNAAWFEEVVLYIHQNYDKDISLDYFANRLNISMGHFSRLFKEAVGVKYVEYVTKVKIEAAKKQLLETNHTIEKIAVDVGYITTNAFIKTFKRYEGITPGKYRTVYGHTK